MESPTFKTLLFITISLMSASSIGFCRVVRRAPGATNTEFIHRSCSTTIYPTLCFSSLSSHASTIQQDPKLLASVALFVSLQTTHVATIDITKMARRSGLSPQHAGAMRDCMEELNNSVYQLKRSMVAMTRIKRQSDFRRIINDVQTWISAALTNEDTCIEGFTGYTGNGVAPAGIRAQIVNVMHTTSNALALINSYASLHS